MPEFESVTLQLRGMYHDVLRNAHGHTIWDSGRRHNTIVTDCRRLLSGFMHGTPTGSLGIQGLQVGAGLAAWDLPPCLPVPNPSQTALADPNPFTVPRVNLQFTYLAGGVVSATPTNTVQIIATLGPNVPTWPDPNHSTSTLREFGLVGQLDGNPVLINYVTHPAIPKDPFSTLERTVWLVF